MDAIMSEGRPSLRVWSWPNERRWPETATIVRELSDDSLLPVPWDEEWAWGRSLAMALGGSVGILARVLGVDDGGALAARLAGLDVPGERDWIVSWIEDDHRATIALDSFEAWIRLARLGGTSWWPRFLALTPDASVFGGWFDGARARLEWDANWQAQALVPESVLQDWLEAHRGTAAALLVEASRVNWPTRETVSCSLSDPTRVEQSEDGRPRQTLSSNEGASPLTVLKRTEALARSLDDEVIAEAERARSLAERELFELLERDAASRGRFLLNRDVGLSWPSGRSLEVDLACLSARIAVEVDGHWHFTDLDRWRRDRLKDLTLQHEGWIVLRFLATDIFERQESVVSTILDALRRRND